ncbi:Hypothetical predicted protein [Mytilus galloprovincialis]|uniref:Uncharacterized protein n=1 Tax=Mytilus galloprovincialis TaxID=29158 RepID=A0A8B6EAH7_MYTGA|nr:Hypothetical predicted protein [Mytilus galloprovincialis]
MEQRKRNTFRKFSRSKSADKKSSRSDYFKWLNDGRKLEDSPHVGLRNDHGNHVYEYLDVWAEAELEGDNTSNVSKSWIIGRKIVDHLYNQQWSEGGEEDDVNSVYSGSEVDN